VRNDRVMVVADDAVGRCRISLDRRSTVQRAPVLGRDPLMTLAAGLDLEQRLDRRGDLVAAVTVDAGRRRTTVDHRAVRASGHRAEVGRVASRAQVRDAFGCRRRARCLARTDIVHAVAADARRRRRRRIAGPLAVWTGRELVGHIVVAHPAVHGIELLGVRQLRTIEVHVAVDAAEIGVNRGGEPRRVDVHGDLGPGAIADELGILVAHQAVVVGLGRHDRRCRQADHQDGAGSEPDQVLQGFTRKTVSHHRNRPPHRITELPLGDVFDVGGARCRCAHPITLLPAPGPPGRDPAAD